MKVAAVDLTFRSSGSAQYDAILSKPGQKILVVTGKGEFPREIVRSWCEVASRQVKVECLP